MSGVSMSASSGGRKSVDQEVNMIPMIDLLVSVIAFLLMTAVWVSAAALQANKTRKGRTVMIDPMEPAHHIELALRADGYRVQLPEGGARREIPRSAHADQDLRTYLREIHVSHPTFDQVILRAESNVRFETIAQTMFMIRAEWEGFESSRPRREVRIEMEDCTGGLCS